MEGFVICDKAGKPIAIELEEGVISGTAAVYGGSGGDPMPVFVSQADAEGVLNVLAGTAAFEGFADGSVRKISFTIGEIVAYQDEDEGDEDEGDEDESE